MPFGIKMDGFQLPCLQENTIYKTSKPEICIKYLTAERRDIQW